MFLKYGISSLPSIYIHNPLLFSSKSYLEFEKLDRHNKFVHPYSQNTDFYLYRSTFWSLSILRIVFKDIPSWYLNLETFRTSSFCTNGTVGSIMIPSAFSTSIFLCKHKPWLFIVISVWTMPFYIGITLKFYQKMWHHCVYL